MSSYEVRQVTYAPVTLGLAHMGARLDIIIGEPTTTDYDVTYKGYSSSSSVYEIPTGSSSSSNVDYAILLFREFSNGRSRFIGVCSPLDLQQWPVDNPDANTGFYRKANSSWTFRDYELLEQFRSKILEYIQSLTNSLSILHNLAQEEELNYDFTISDSEIISSSLQDERSFTLIRSPVVFYPIDNPVGYRLHVTCTAIGTDPKIFLHRLDLPESEEVKERPIAVCSPGDLVDYPSDAPDENQFPAHYRKATFDIVTADITLLNEGWNNIKLEVEQLAAALAIHQDNVSSLDVEQITSNV